MKSGLKLTAKLCLFFVGEFFAVILITGLIGLRYLFVSIPIYAIARGAVASFVFKTFRDSVLIFSAASTVMVLAICLIIFNQISIMVLMLSFAISFVASLISWLVCDTIRTRKPPQTKSTFTTDDQRPYITTAEELKLFESARAKIDDAETDRAIDYGFFKAATCKSIYEQSNLVFRDACINECKNSLERLANEGVYYLMHFISLGVLSKYNLQKVDFIEAELKHIQKSGRPALLKSRINDQSYGQIEKDLQEALDFYNSAD